MDLEINIECRQCGWVFSQALREMPHGRHLKCPFCCGLELKLGEGALVEGDTGSEKFEPSFEDRFLEQKIKL